MRRLLLLLPLCLAACDPADVTDATTGTYVEEKDISQTGDPDYFTQGCDSSGNPVLQLDPRIKVGTVLGQIQKVQTDGVGIGELGITDKITGAANNTLTENYTMDKVSNYSGYTQGQNFNIQCKLSGTSVSCGTDGPTNTGAEHAKYEDCQFTAQPTVTGKLTKGKYTFSSGGPVVTAFKLTLTGKAAMKCGTETFNDAQVDQTLLTSNDIPSTDFNFCGGTVISFYAKITGASKTLKAAFSERTKAGMTLASPTGHGTAIAPNFASFFDTEFINVKPGFFKTFSN